MSNTYRTDWNNIDLTSPDIDLDLDEILEHYLIAALWSSTDDNGIPLDQGYCVDDVAESAKKQQLEEITDFLNYCDKHGLLKPLVTLVNQYDYTEQQLGHDLWLTRNGHGAGFWDRDLGELGRQLSNACKTFGSCDVYVGDDGLIYFH